VRHCNSARRFLRHHIRLFAVFSLDAFGDMDLRSQYETMQTPQHMFTVVLLEI
jgi:hypothetical protein